MFLYALYGKKREVLVSGIMERDYNIEDGIITQASNILKFKS